MEEEIIERITKYFRNKNEVKFINTKITLLSRQITDIENDIANTHISLNFGVGGIRYDVEKFYTGFKENAYERQLELAITRFENAVIEKKNELVSLRLELHEIEVEIVDFERVLARAGISDEMLRLLRFKYHDNYTYTRIAMEVSKSETTVRRNILSTQESICNCFIDKVVNI